MTNKKNAILQFINNFIGETDYLEELTSYLNQITNVLKLERNEVLFIDGEDGKKLFFILSGKIRLSKLGCDGREKTIRIVEKNQLFGEVVLAENSTYPLNATCADKAQVLSISVAGFKIICKEYPDIMMKMLLSMATQLRYLLSMTHEMASSDAKHRLVSYINTLSDKYGSNEVELPSSKRDVAMMIGVAPETISRLFSKLQEEGIIRVEKKRIILLNK